MVWVLSEMVPAPRLLPRVRSLRPSKENMEEWSSLAVLMTIGNEVSAKIVDRVGRTRAQAAGLATMRSAKEDLRLRLYLAQLIVVVSPESLAASAFASPRMKDEGRSTALMVFIEALGSSDELCRAGAAYALSLCGPEACDAIPLLESAATDSSSRVRLAAKAALEKIQVQ